MASTIATTRYRLDGLRVIDTQRDAEVCICLDEAYAYRIISGLNLADAIPDPIPKVAVAFPYYKQFEGPTAVAAMGLGIRSAFQVGMLPIQCPGGYIERNRNSLVKFAKKTGIPFDYIFWIDTDMIFPEDSLLCLLERDKDIVGANYRTRVAPFKHAGHYLDGTDDHILEPGLVPMGHVPTGLLLTRMSVYDHLPYPWFKAPSDDEEPRDDVYFCNLARAHGYEVWCDHDLTRRVYHRTAQDLGWFDEKQVVVSGGMGIIRGEEQAMGDARARDAGESYHRAQERSNEQRVA